MLPPTGSIEMPTGTASYRLCGHCTAGSRPGLANLTDRKGSVARTGSPACAGGHRRWGGGCAPAERRGCGRRAGSGRQEIAAMRAEPEQGLTALGPAHCPNTAPCGPDLAGSWFAPRRALEPRPAYGYGPDLIARAPWTRLFHQLCLFQQIYRGILTARRPWQAWRRSPGRAGSCLDTQSQGRYRWPRRS